MLSNAYRAPITRSGLFLRDELTDKILSNINKIKTFRSFYLFAPGGYGKTILLTQTTDSTQCKSAWITLNKSYNSQEHFYGRVTDALKNFGGRNYKKFVENVAEWNLESFLAAINHLPKRGKRSFLIIDDMHLLTNPALLIHFPLWIACLPSWLVLGMAGRTAPHDAIASIDNILVIGKEELAFRKDEIKNFFALYDYDLSQEELDDLYNKTQGWAIGIHAFMLGAKEEGNIPADILDAALFQSYLDRKLWINWSEEKRLFLMQCAFVEKMIPELCDTITERTDAAATLETLYQENLFMTKRGESYRLHDLFRDYLIGRANIELSKKEIDSIYDKAGNYYFKKRDYLFAADFFLNSQNHAGINRCLKAVNTFKENKHLSVEMELNFMMRRVVDLPHDFILQNPYLLEMRVWEAFLNGRAEEFLRYVHILFEMLPSFVADYPDLLETSLFMGSLDFSVPLRNYALQALGILQNMPAPEQAEASEEKTVHSISITHNLPFFHRSMRDYSEYHELLEEDLSVLRQSFGLMIGYDYPVMENCIKAGVLYEQNRLLEALQLCLDSYFALSEAMHPETIFCTKMLFAAVMQALGSEIQSNKLYHELDLYIKQDHAHFLHANFKAAGCIQHLKQKDKETAKEWLAVFAVPVDDQLLSFFGVYQHFASLRAHIALKNYESACIFAEKLVYFGESFQRPLDVIEAKILWSIALNRTGKQTSALQKLGEAIFTATPYKFTRRFINESVEIMDLLHTLGRKRNNHTPFITRIISEILDEQLPKEQETQKLTAQQKNMLAYLRDGLSAAQIAAETGLTKGTVRNHLSSLYKALDVHNAEEALERAGLLGF